MAKSVLAQKMDRKLTAKRTESLTDKAYSVLEEMIVTLRLEPGEVLSEVALSQELKIGRTPIREALQRLAREGLVLILPRKGILVSDINPRKQLLLLEVRRELERLIARSAAQRATPGEKQAFAAIADGIEKASKDKSKDSTKDKPKANKDAGDDKSETDAQDYQLSRALDLIRGLAILSQNAAAK